MESDKILLLAQIAESMADCSRMLEMAYNSNDKKKFDSAKAAILDFQSKISFLLRENLRGEKSG